MAEHVNNLVSASGQSLYALKLLKAHGLRAGELSNICRATLVSKLIYASASWVGFTLGSDRDRLQAVLAKAIRWGVYDPKAPDIETIINKADRPF